MKAFVITSLIFLLSHVSFAQADTSIVHYFKDSTSYKVVIRTESLVNNEYIALDNLTARVKGDTTNVYYMNYGDGMVSQMMIPYPTYEDFLAFEQRVNSFRTSDSKTTYSVKIEIGNKHLRIPIDILHLEELSSFMLKLEE